MSKSRQDIVMLAYRKLDKSGDGVVSVDDLKGVYSVQRHPRFISGEATQEQLFGEFLKTFEIGSHVDSLVMFDWCSFVIQCNNEDTDCFDCNNWSNETFKEDLNLWVKEGSFG
jgi:hypothetical protein